MREKYSFYLALATGGLIFLVTVLFAFVQSPEILSATVRMGAAIPHQTEGRGECDSCHTLRAANPYPIRHLGWSNSSCTRCHAPLLSDVTISGENARQMAPAGGAIPLGHGVEDHGECLTCHAPDQGEWPAPLDHLGRPVEGCLGCHGVGPSPAL